MTKPCRVKAPPEKRPSNVKQSTEQKVRSFYSDLSKRSGILSSAQKLELKLRENFIVSASKVAIPHKLGQFNWVESQMASLLGWKKWLWQKSTEFTSAGAVRETFVRSANVASETIRLIALDQAIPQIRKLTSELKKATGLSGQELEKLIHDQIVIGSYPSLLNVNPSDVVNNFLRKRYLNHLEKLRELGLSDETIATLDELGTSISSKFDELLVAARESGYDLDTLENGGYFPIQATREFDKWANKGKGTFTSGFKSLLDDVQKSRKLGFPFALDEDRLVGLLQNRLLNEDLSDESLFALSQKELDIVSEQAAKVQEKIQTFTDQMTIKEQKAISDLEETLSKQEFAAKRKALQLLEAKEQSQVNTLRAKLTGEYSKVEQEAIVQKLRDDWVTRKAQAADKITESYERKLQKGIQTIERNTDKTIVEKTKRLYADSSKHTKAILRFEEARMALREVQASPEGLTPLLNTLKPGQIERLWHSGALTQIPMLSDELENYFRGLDVGVKGLADAIITNPVEAIKRYAADLSENVRKTAYVKQMLTDGFDEGWVTSTPPDNTNYELMTNNPIIREALGSGKLSMEVGDLWIHKTIAKQLNSLVEINSSPTALSVIASAYQMFTSTFGKSLIVGTGGLPYLQRVFVQNLPAVYASGGTDALVQLPFSIVENSRVLANGLEAIDNTKKVFLGGKVTARELYSEFVKRSGGSVISGFQDKVDPYGGLFQTFSSTFWKRNWQFHEAYFRKFGNPVTGAIGTMGKLLTEVGSDVLNSLYSPLAFGNEFLDTAAKWAVVRYLASDSRYSTIDEVISAMRETFDLSSDPGSVGSFVGSNVIPFASFALNAPGSAIRHALNRPYRAMNIMQLYGQAAAATDLREAELPPWLRESQQFAFQVFRDPEGKIGVIMPGTVDYMLDSYSWMLSIARDLTGDKSTTSLVRDKSTIDAITRRVQEVVSKTYVGNLVNALQGLDPRTLEPVLDPDAQTTFFGAPISKQLRTLIDSSLPILGSIEKALPAQLVGKAAVTEQGLLGQRTIEPGVPSAFGFVPAKGQGANTKEKALLSALTGVNVTEIDPKGNLITSYRDFSNRLKEIETTRRGLYRQLATRNDLPEGQRETIRQRITQLGSLAVILEFNKQQIDAYAVRKGLPIPRVMELLRKGSDEVLAAPLQDDTEINLLRLMYGGQTNDDR